MPDDEISLDYETPAAEKLIEDRKRVLVRPSLSRHHRADSSA
jgi:hypothetical protein